MHGTEHCERKLRALRLSATPQPSYRPRDRHFQARHKITSARDRSLVTAFCSPAKAAPSRSLHQGVKAPGLLLRFLPHALAARSDPHSTAASGLPQTRLLHGVNPVAAPAYGLRNCCAGPSPLRDFYLPRDQRQNRLRRYTVRLPNSPDLPSLPAAAVSMFSNGSSFQVRYVFGGLLFLKPLGTSFTMLPEALCVKRY
jgi:hypothetical protein